MYKINEMFYSIQGEGVRTGIPHLFIRFSKCNLRCTADTVGFDCDTEFDTGTEIPAKQLIEQLRSLSQSCEQILLTGGEPFLQLDVALASTLRAAGYSLAVETNGTIDPGSEVLDCIDWITVSPKPPFSKIEIPKCDELKCVLAAGMNPPTELFKNCKHRLVSPAFEGKKPKPNSIDWCVEYVKKNPDWRLTLQLHKLLGVA